MDVFPYFFSCYFHECFRNLVETLDVCFLSSWLSPALRSWIKVNVCYNVLFSFSLVEKKIRENDERSFVHFYYQNMNSLYSGHHNVNSFNFVFISKYTRKTHTGTSTKIEQINNRAEFCCLRKFASIVGGFRQTVTISSDIQVSIYWPK